MVHQETFSLPVHSKKSVILTVIHTFNRKCHKYILHDHEPNSLCSSQMHKKKDMDKMDCFHPHTIQSDTALTWCSGSGSWKNVACSKEVENRYIIFMFCKSVVANKTTEYRIVPGVIASPAVYKQTQRPPEGFFYQNAFDLSILHFSLWARWNWFEAEFM